MKRIGMLWLVMASILAGCGDLTVLLVEERDVAIDWRYNIYSPGALISWDIKWEELPDVIEISDAAVIAAVTELTGAAEYRDRQALNFTYQLEIREVLFDTTGTLRSGGSAAMTSGEGAITLAELKPKLDYTGSVYISKYQKNSPDSSWLLATRHDATPIEVGKTYLLFLEQSGEEEIWTESGYAFLWEVAEDKLVRGDGLSKWYDEEYTLEIVRDLIAARSGRCDEIGEAAYIREVKAKEAAERRSAQASLRERMDIAAAKRTGEAVPMKKRNIVHTIENDLFLGDTLRQRLEDSTAAVICRIADLNASEGADGIVIRYEIEVEEILFDRENEIAVGDSLDVRGFSGLVAAWQAQELIGFWESSMENNILQDGYLDGDYVSITNCGGIPAEEGKRYLMLLKPAFTGQDYFESGGAYFFEYTDGRLYIGDGRKSKRADMQLNDIRAAIAEMDE